MQVAEFTCDDRCRVGLENRFGLFARVQVLAHDTAGTLEEARRLWQIVDRPNLMVKIPATLEGLPAIQAAIADGININVTLIFSVERYNQVIDAFLAGLEERQKVGLPIDKIASVASFFVSRVDSKVDQMLDRLAQSGNLSADTAKQMQGKAALANTRLAYQMFLKRFSEPRFQKLQAAGAGVQRPLWASTSTKNPAYPDVLYVSDLIVPDTVNTMPPKTLSAFIDHGQAQIGFDPADDSPQKVLSDLEALGIQMSQVTTELEIEGVEAFANAYRSLLAVLETRVQSFSGKLPPLKDQIPVVIARHTEAHTIQRLFDHDISLWTNDPNTPEISNRLGWLDLPKNSRKYIDALNEFKTGCIRSGLKHAVLLGMGGSSLGSDVIARTLKAYATGVEKALDLSVLDSTDPHMVLHVSNTFDLSDTLFIVSSKSGTTSETISLMEFFWEKAQQVLGAEAGSHFVVVTDPGSRLEQTGKERGYRAVFSADPNVGGRFSALTNFGLLPAVLLGVDISKFLAAAEKVRHTCSPDVPAYRNPGLALGAIMAESAHQGRDKLTFLTDEELDSFGGWAEQLIAESSGKEGRGIIPVDTEPLLQPPAYGDDRLFVYLRTKGAQDDFVNDLVETGQPVLVFNINDFYQLPELFYTWEVAVAIACSDLHVTAFNQPNVQDSKDRTRKKIAQLKAEGKLHQGTPVLQTGDYQVFAEGFSSEAETLPALLEDFLSQLMPGNYLAINAFLPMIEEISEPLQKLRKKIAAEHQIATTLGFGPRFLHSTGQLHKGGPAKGFFLAFSWDDPQGLEIPGQDITFNDLINAQAQGDIEALYAQKRPVLHIHLSGTTALRRVFDLLD